MSSHPKSIQATAKRNQKNKFNTITVQDAYLKPLKELPGDIYIKSNRVNEALVKLRKKNEILEPVKQVEIVEVALGH